MPTTTFNYGDWSFWRPYFPPDGYYGESRIAFDGPNRLILIAEGETLISVKSQIYSVWKRWVQVPGANNARWPQAISAVGGDPITTTEFLGATFFLENGWRIQPFSQKGLAYTLTINGNLFTREVGDNPFLIAEGVSVSLVRSNIVDLIRVESLEANITPTDLAAIADSVWDEILSEHQTDGTTGKKLKDNLTQLKYIARI